MSFSHKVKQELCRVQPVCPDCEKALAYGMLLFSRAFTGNSTFLQTEHRDVMHRYVDALSALTAPILSVETTNFFLREESRIYTVSVPDERDRDAICLFFAHDQEKPLTIHHHWMPRGCCAISFIRGAFLVCGSVSDPQKDYHLEFAVDSHELAETFRAYLSENGVECKHTARKNTELLYQKDSTAIEEILTLLGASKQALEIMELKIIKEVRNRTNRQTNCETANLTKTVLASRQQIEDIRLIEARIGLSELPEELRELASLRLEYPDLSLRELQELLSVPVSRSGVHHRLKKLTQIAADLRKKGE